MDAGRLDAVVCVDEIKKYVGEFGTNRQKQLIKGDEMKTQEELGQELIKLLGLKVKKNGRIDTEWGDKTPLGLFLSIERIIEGR